MAEKIRVEGAFITAAPKLSTYQQDEHTALHAFAINKDLASTTTDSEEIDFEYHVVRALVDLAPPNIEDFTRDFTSFYYANLHQQIIDNIKNNPMAEEELVRVEKTKSLGEVLRAPPVLADYENESRFLLPLLINYNDPNNLDHQNLKI